MAEKKYVHLLDGQEVEEDDLNGISENAALADDRVLAELVRVRPYNGTSPSRGIMPYGYLGAAPNLSDRPLIRQNGASAS